MTVAMVDDRHEQRVRPGFFTVQLVAHGPHLPAVIYRPCRIDMHKDWYWTWIDRWPLLEAGYDADLFRRIKTRCDPVFIWHRGREIDYAEWLGWMKTRQHIYLHEPWAADFDPRKPVDLSKMPAIGPIL